MGSMEVPSPQQPGAARWQCPRGWLHTAATALDPAGFMAMFLAILDGKTLQHHL
jgi:hypothetical protein